MISSFKDKETNKIWNEEYSKRFPNDIQRIGLRKLILIHRASNIKEFKMEKIPLITPGEILVEEFLGPLNITPYRLAKDTNVPPTRISQIIKGHRKITADTALRLAAYFGNSADFWLGIQSEYDLRKERLKLAKELQKIPHIRAS
ncbi:MAG: HigA family addiction module antitoxin [Spirochaetaceae bacterium]